MKSFLLLFLLGASLASRVIAGEQVYKITPASLADWGFTDIGSALNPSEPSLTLPARAQLVRSFGNGTVVLHAVSWPNFSKTEVDWPILVVGPLAVVFKLEKGAGQIVIVGSDGSIQPISDAVAVDSSGRSAQPLDIVVAYDPATGASVFSYSDQFRSLQFGTSNDAVEVVISAGATLSWVQESLEVVIFTEDNGAPETKTKSVTGASSAGLNRLAQVTKSLSSSGADQLAETRAIATPAPKAAVPGKPEMQLEIFTPPAVRQIRPEWARSVVANAQGK